MKQCSLEQFAESLDLWLDQNYIRAVSIDGKGRVSFTFMDGVKDTYQIAGCGRSEMMRACRCLAERGVPVRKR